MAAGPSFAGFGFKAAVAPNAARTFTTALASWDDEAVVKDLPDFVMALGANGIESTNGNGVRPCTVHCSFEL